MESFFYKINIKKFISETLQITNEIYLKHCCLIIFRARFFNVNFTVIILYCKMKYV